jgi:hypothetical protein
MASPKPPPGSRSSPGSRLPYHGLTRPTLQGLPQDLKDTVSGFLPPRDLAKMQQTGKAGVRMTKNELKLPSEGEITAYVNDILDRKTETRVSFYAPETPPADQDQGSQANVRVFRFHVGVGRGLGHSVTDYSIGYSQEEGSVDWAVPSVSSARAIPMRTNPIGRDELSLTLSGGNGVPDPFTVLEIVRRRAGCRSDYESEHPNREYGVDIAERYRLATVYPFLDRVVDLELYRDVATTDQRDTAIRQVTDDDPEAVRDYQINLEKSRVLVWAWMGLASRQTLDDYVASWRPPTTAQELGEGARVVLRAYDSDSASSYLTSRSESGDDVLLPTHDEIIAYLMTEMEAGRALRFVLYDPNHDGHKFSITIVESDTDEDVQYLRHTTTTILRPSARRRDFAYKISPSSRMPFSDSEVNVELLAYLDPITVLSVMKSRPEAATDPTYGELAVQAYMRKLMAPFISPFLADADVERVYGPDYAFISEEDILGSLETEQERLDLRELVLLTYGWLESRYGFPEILYDKDEPVMAIKRVAETYLSLSSTGIQEGGEEGAVEGEAEEVPEEEAAREDEAAVPTAEEEEGEDLGDESVADSRLGQTARDLATPTSTDGGEDEDEDDEAV